MAKIVAAYIAEGSDRSGQRKYGSPLLLNEQLQLAWKRLYATFRFLKRFESDNSNTRYLVFSDHKPPAVDGVLCQRLFDDLGVDISLLDFLWRSDAQPQRPDFFVFDAIEELTGLAGEDDEVLLLGPEAIVVGDVSEFFTELQSSGVLAVERSVGEVSEALLVSYREQVGVIRQELKTPWDPQCMMAINANFLSISAAELKAMFKAQRRIFPKNNLRAVRGQDFLSEPGEMLAAMIAEIGFLKPNLKALTDEVAAMPDEVDAFELTGAPVILPGYGREPDIGKLFNRLLPDQFDKWSLVDPVVELTHLVHKSRGASFLRHLIIGKHKVSRYPPRRPDHSVAVAG